MCREDKRKKVKHTQKLTHTEKISQKKRAILTQPPSFEEMTIIFIALIDYGQKLTT